MAWRVCSLNSNLTGRPVSFVEPLHDPPRSWRRHLRPRMATTSQPRSLLSIARLNIARSRTRPSIWSFVRIDQTCFGRRGGFAQLAFVPRHALVGRRDNDHFILHSRPPRLQTLRRMEPPGKALESGQRSDHFGRGPRRRLVRPVAFDPRRTSYVRVFAPPMPAEDAQCLVRQPKHLDHDGRSRHAAELKREWPTFNANFPPAQSLGFVVPMGHSDRPERTLLHGFHTGILG